MCLIERFLLKNSGKNVKQTFFVKLSLGSSPWVIMDPHSPQRERFMDTSETPTVPANATDTAPVYSQADLYEMGFP